MKIIKILHWTIIYQKDPWKQIQIYILHPGVKLRSWELFEIKTSCLLSTKSIFFKSKQLFLLMDILYRNTSSMLKINKNVFFFKKVKNVNSVTLH